MGTEPNKAHLSDGTPTISLGGVLWPIPKLTIRQLRRLQGKLDPTFDAVIRKTTPFDALTPEQFDDLGLVVYVALTRAHPTLTLEEFEAMEMDWGEMVRALVTIWLQAIAPPRDPRPGEGLGEPRPSITTH
jgi:hypothetical protein